MKKLGLLESSALRSAAFIALAATVATPAFAQDDGAADDGVTTQDTAFSDEDTEGAIIVTGSRIRRPNLDSTVPITSVSPNEVLDRGGVSLGDALNDLPSLRSTFSQSNSTRFLGTGGVNYLDLRGMGTERTLVLVNGRRHVASAVGAQEVDVNTIPSDLIERVDIVTGGNSAIYGSDAVAGVVNFVLRNNFDGLRVRVQGGISAQGDWGSYFGSLTYGRNFAGGRGNVVLALEYARQDPVLGSDRDDLTGSISGGRTFASTDVTLGEPSTGDGIADATFQTGLRSNQFSTGGGVIVGCPTAAAAGETVAHFNRRRALNCTGRFGPTGAAGGELPYVFHFDPQGNLIRNDAAAGVTADLRVFGDANGYQIGGLGSTFGEIFQLMPENNRYSANLLARFEVSPAFAPFIEAKYVRIETVALSSSGPVFQSGVLPTTMRLDNPFLSDSARATLAEILPTGATTFTMARNNVDFGGRAEFQTRETARVVAGLRGDITPHVRYEASFNHGRLDTFYETGGNVSLARYAAAQDAARDTASGNIVCRINIDANPNNNDPNCVPLNLFGNGAPSRAALDYVLERSFRNQEARQYVGAAFVSGDTGGFFELPGGPIGWALGVEWRRETAESVYDPVVSNPVRQTFLNSIAPFRPPALEVREAYGELRIPILRDLPFARELTIEGAARISDFNVGPKEPLIAWNLGVTYSPVSDIRFRASLARSVRAPTLSDLYSPLVQTFSFIADPCSQDNINNNPNRVRNCADAGVPTTYTLPDGRVVPFINTQLGSPAGASRGNPDTLEETSTSLTLGVVLEPRAIPGLSLTVDYYNIEVENVIFTLAGPTVAQLCYDNPSGIDNQYCNAIFRRPDGTFAGQAGITIGGTNIEYAIGSGPCPGATCGVSFFQQPFNFARQIAEGIDFDLTYRTRLASNTVLNLRAIVSYLMKRENYTDATDPNFATRVHGTLGDPVWAATGSINLDFGAVDVGYTVQFIDRMTVGAWNLQNSYQGRAPTNPDAFASVFYPQITYHNLRFGFEPESRFRFYTGIDNVFDQSSPAQSGLAGTGAGGAIYPVVGRYFYAGVDVRF